MTQAEKIKAEIERLKKSLPWGSCASQISMECNCKNEAYNEVLSYIDSLSDTEKDFGIKESVIPFGASDSELMEATYFIPQGYHADIDGNKVIIKKGEEPVSNDLEEAAWVYYDKNKPLIPHELDLHKEMISFFIAGAQWQKEQDQSTIELAEDHAMLAGMEKMKEEMMKDAVDGVVFTKLDDGSIMVRTHYFKSDKIDYLDEVKLIIIKEE